jgi:hypothetical protein
MKKRVAIILSIIILFNFIILINAQNQEISPTQASDKIIEHGYGLIYANIQDIKNLGLSPQSFDFITSDKTHVSFGPTGLQAQKKWFIVIAFNYKEGTTSTSLIEEKENRNETLLQYPKNELKKIFDEEGMVVSLKNGTSFNLSSEEDLSSFKK